jgi:hypothetical protein
LGQPAFFKLDLKGQVVQPSFVKLTPQQKLQGKWQRALDYKRVARIQWLTMNDRKLLQAILDLRHMKHSSACGTDCEPGWAKIPRDQLKKDTAMGQDKLNETVKRLVDRKVIQRNSDGEHAGRDGATRYRIIALPLYEPATESATGDPAENLSGPQ